jgi:ACS family allantoate permease-like MFS transporter
MLWLLPDTPENARFLSRSQKLQAVERVRGNQMTLKSNIFRWDQFVEGLLDPKVLVVCLFLICVTVCNSSLTAVSGQANTFGAFCSWSMQFSQIVLVGLGLNVYQANLFTIATGAIHGFFGITATYICSRYRDVRCIACIVLCLIRLV